MPIDSVTLRNYRAFGPDGATLPLRHEFVAVTGLNNSGKSSLLRAMYELRPVFGGIANSFGEAGRATRLLSLEGEGGAGVPQLLAGERVWPAISDTSEPRITLTFAPPDEVQLITLVLRRNGALRMELRTRSGVTFGDETTVQTVSDGRGGIAHELRRPSGQAARIDWVSVAADLRRLSDSMYVGAFRNAINAGGSDYYDLATGTQFISVFDQYKTGPDYVSNQAVRRMCRQLGRIFDVEDLDVSATPDKSGLVYSFGDGTYRGSELGAGLTQFVIVAANVLVRRPSLLLIDEPELNLHASLQLKFLTLLAQQTQGPVIFATHSVGLARSGADVVLVASRDANGLARVDDWKATPNLSVTLGELGYGGLHDMAHRAVLLVEGVTEVRAFQELLAKWGIRNEIVIVPLGGDDLATAHRAVELAELRRLAPNVFAVVDSERDSAGGEAAARRLEFRRSCQQQGILCHILDRRAFENYVDLGVAREVMRQPDAPAFDAYSRPPAEWSWSKERNWRVVRAMSREQFEGTDLAAMLDAIVAVADGSHHG